MYIMVGGEMMYYIDKSKPLNKRIWFENQKKASEEIGIHFQTLSKILNGKQGTQKTTAFCITKLFNKDGEIEDYFIKTKGE